MQNTLKIGWAMTDITPSLPVHRAAGPSMQVSDTVMDPITATALVIESASNNGKRDMAILVSCDLGMIRMELLDRVRELVAGQHPDMVPHKIVIMATHTHTAPCVRTGLDVAAQLAEYGLEVPRDWSWFGVAPGNDIMSPAGFLNFAAPRIARAIGDAWQNRRAGGISFGLGHAVVGYNRLTAYYDAPSRMYGNANQPDFSHIEGYEDHSIGLLATYDDAGNLTGMAVNLACPAQVSEGSRMISADFWHDTRMELRRRLGEKLYILPQCSAAGDQSPHVPINRAAEARMLYLKGLTDNLPEKPDGNLGAPAALRKEIALRIADAATATLPHMARHIQRQPVFMHHAANIELSARLVTDEEARSRRLDFERLLEEYRAMRKEIEAHPETQKQPGWFNAISAVHWKMARAARVVDRYELQNAAPPHRKQYWRLQGQQRVDRNEPQKTTLTTPVHVIRIGEWVIATNPFELYLDFGLQIKARSQATQTFVVQLANGYYQYLPTERSVVRGAYGAIPESNQVSPHGGCELVNFTVATIEKLWS